MARRRANARAGLGLALARRLARSVTIEVENQSGHGGRFIIRPGRLTTNR
jgi:hypothetical protein